MQGFISKRFSQIIFHNQGDSIVFKETTVKLPDFPSVVAQAHSHTHFTGKQLTPENNPSQTLVFVTTP
jgi:hypothetical protein